MSEVIVTSDLSYCPDDLSTVLDNYAAGRYDTDSPNPTDMLMPVVISGWKVFAEVHKVASYYHGGQCFLVVLKYGPDYYGIRRTPAGDYVEVCAVRSI